MNDSKRFANGGIVDGGKMFIIGGHHAADAFPVALVQEVTVSDAPDNTALITVTVAVNVTLPDTSYGKQQIALAFVKSTQDALERFRVGA